MDFITSLPRNTKKNNVSMVWVDKLSKEAHFVVVKFTYIMSDVAQVFIK